MHDTPLKGLIIDMRGNSGGWFNVLTGVLGNFMRGDAGGYTSNNSDIQARIKEQDIEQLKVSTTKVYPLLQNLPVVVLVDKGTQSTAEIFTAVLQSRGRIKVVGTKSGGNTEGTNLFDFKDGSRLWLAEEAYHLPDGTNLEAKGVVPDAAVNVDWTDYTEQDDPQIVKAVELIHSASTR